MSDQDNFILTNEQKCIYVTATLRRLGHVIHPSKRERYRSVLSAINSGDTQELNWLLDECILVQLNAAVEIAE